MQNIYYTLFILIISGLALSRIAKKIRLPNVTAFLIAGLVVGPYVLNIVSGDVLDNMRFISEIGMGLIAYSIGSEFKISYFKRLGMTPVVIATLNAFVAMIFVVVAIVAFGFPLPLALVLGAIAAATAPAATVMVIKQYQARGPFTETLLSVVAIDDAVTLIIFGFNAAIARTLIAGNFKFVSLLTPIVEILGSMLAGAILGLILTFAFRFFNSRGNRLILLIGFIALGIFVSNLMKTSSLLLLMTMSGVVANLYHDYATMHEELNHFTPPIFMLFFVLAGARLDPRVLPTVGLLGVIYLVVRVIGKLTGAYVGAVIMKAPDDVRKYLGPALIPQAGVAIGLSFAAQSIVPMYATQIHSVILTATLIYELFGPIATKWSLGKAGEIKL